MAQDHGDVFSLKGAFKNAVFLAGFTEGVFWHGSERSLEAGEGALKLFKSSEEYRLTRLTEW